MRMGSRRGAKSPDPKGDNRGQIAKRHSCKVQIKGKTLDLPLRFTLWQKKIRRQAGDDPEAEQTILDDVEVDKQASCFCFCLLSLSFLKPAPSIAKMSAEILSASFW